MPYKSQAQRRLFHFLAKQGKLAPETVEEYDRESKGKKMPEYAKKKAFGGQIQAKAGTRCPACDLPLDSAPVALDAGEGCPRCGYGDAKEVPQKARGGEIMDETSYRARGGEVERKSLPRSIKYDANMGKEGLAKLNSAVARMRRIESDLPYNPAPWHEREEEYKKPLRMTADPTIPKRRAFGWMDVLDRRAGDLTFLPEGSLGVAQEKYEEEPTPENARIISKAAQELAKIDPKFSEEWRKNTSGRMGDLKAVDRYAHGGEVHCAHCGSVSYVPLKAMGGEIGDGLHGDMKEMYPSRKDKGSRLDDGKIGFAKAIKRR
jgi:hypothetical protein